MRVNAELARIVRGASVGNRSGVTLVWVSFGWLSGGTLACALVRDMIVGELLRFEKWLCLEIRERGGANL